MQSNLFTISANTTNKLKASTACLKTKLSSSNSSTNSSSSSSASNNEHHNTNNWQTAANNNSQLNAASTSLWIGNVDPNVTEEMLTDLFSAYGQLANVRCLPEKYCAFVNFKLKDDANKALLNLQVNSSLPFIAQIIIEG